MMTTNFVKLSKKSPSKSLIRWIGFLGLSLGISLGLGCSKKPEDKGESKISINLPLDAKAFQSLNSANRVLKNLIVQVNSSPTSPVIASYRYEEGEGIVAPPSRILFTVPKGRGRIFQVVAIYKSISADTLTRDRTQLFYAQTTRDLVTDNETINLLLGSLSPETASVGDQFISGDLMGRYGDPTGPLNYEFFTGRLQSSFQRDLSMPPIFISESSMLYGWFQGAIFSGGAVRHTLIRANGEKFVLWGGAPLNINDDRLKPENIQINGLTRNQKQHLFRVHVPIHEANRSWVEQPDFQTRKPELVVYGFWNSAGIPNHGEISVSDYLRDTFNDAVPDHSFQSAAQWGTRLDLKRYGDIPTEALLWRAYRDSDLSPFYNLTSLLFRLQNTGGTVSGPNFAQFRGGAPYGDSLTGHLSTGVATAGRIRFISKPESAINSSFNSITNNPTRPKAFNLTNMIKNGSYNIAYPPLMAFQSRNGDTRPFQIAFAYGPGIRKGNYPGVEYSTTPMPAYFDLRLKYLPGIPLNLFDRLIGYKRINFDELNYDSANPHSCSVIIDPVTGEPRNNFQRDPSLDLDLSMSAQNKVRNSDHIRIQLPFNSNISYEALKEHTLGYCFANQNQVTQFGFVVRFNQIHEGDDPCNYSGADLSSGTECSASVLDPSEYVREYLQPGIWTLTTHTIPSWAREIVFEGWGAGAGGSPGAGSVGGRGGDGGYYMQKTIRLGDDLSCPGSPTHLSNCCRIFGTNPQVLSLKVGLGGNSSVNGLPSNIRCDGVELAEALGGLAVSGGNLEVIAAQQQAKFNANVSYHGGMGNIYNGTTGGGGGGGASSLGVGHTPAGYTMPFDFGPGGLGIPRGGAGGPGGKNVDFGVGQPGKFPGGGGGGGYGTSGFPGGPGANGMVRITFR